MALYNMLDQIRVQRGLLWRDVAREAGVASSLFSRMRNGRSPDLNGFAKVCWWANLDANEILGVTGTSVQQVLILAIANDTRLTRDQKHALSTIVRSFYVKG
jgi:transcriptional regulator with XRE-family HTH domain